MFKRKTILIKSVFFLDNFKASNSIRLKFRWDCELISEEFDIKNLYGAGSFLMTLVKVLNRELNETQNVN